MRTTAIKSGTPASGPTLPQERPGRTAASPAIKIERGVLYQIVAFCASLRITVVLFVLSFILVFYGTWAQVDAGIWTVVTQYFRSFFVWIPLKVILLRTVDIPGAIPYPGGWTLGALLLTNLFAAHAIRFKLSWNRAGILILHLGLVLMMIGEFVTGLFAIEGRMTIAVGQSSNFVDHDRKAEIAVIDTSDPKVVDEVTIPQSYLKNGKLIQHADLPFDIEVLSFMANSRIDRAGDGTTVNPATAGVGLIRVATELPETSGVSTDQAIEFPAAYVTLKKKNSGASLGTYLLSGYYTFILRPADEILENGKKYQIVLRSKRSYRPYTIFLKGFRHEVFPGTDIPRNYQSDVRLVDKERSEDRNVKIYMNHPLRYEGETFYQASLHPLTRGTVLQVVRNPGWLMPYFSCGLVTFGMLVHFGALLIGFIRRSVA